MTHFLKTGHLPPQTPGSAARPGKAGRGQRLTTTVRFVPRVGLPPPESAGSSACKGPSAVPAGRRERCYFSLKSHKRLKSQQPKHYSKATGRGQKGISRCLPSNAWFSKKISTADHADRNLCRCRLT